MAKKTTEVATVPDDKFLQSDMVPAWMEADGAGTEHLTSEDMQLPRIALAQKMSYQVDKDHSSYIEGLEVGEFFNSATEDIYGPDPLRFVILRADPPRHIEFDPDTRKLIDPHVPRGDARTKWTEDGEPPQASLFYNYLVLLLDHNEELGVISLSRTGVRAAKRLNTLFGTKIKQGKRLPVYAGIYVARPGTEDGPKGKYGVWIFNNAGLVQDQEAFNRYKAMASELADTSISTDWETSDETGTAEKNVTPEGAPEM